MRLREGIQEETARVEGHLREDTRTFCSGNIIKYIR